jgi:hypothetical protein
MSCPKHFVASTAIEESSRHLSKCKAPSSLPNTRGKLLCCENVRRTSEVLSPTYSNLASRFLSPDRTYEIGSVVDKFGAKRPQPWENPHFQKSLLNAKQDLVRSNPSKAKSSRFFLRISKVIYLPALQRSHCLPMHPIKSEDLQRKKETFVGTLRVWALSRIPGKRRRGKWLRREASRTTRTIIPPEWISKVAYALITFRLLDDARS